MASRERRQLVHTDAGCAHECRRVVKRAWTGHVGVYRVDGQGEWKRYTVKKGAAR